VHPDVPQAPGRAAAGPAPVIEPGHTFASITDKISTIVLTRRTPRGWFFGFGSRVSVIWLLSWPVLRQRNVFWLLVPLCGLFGFLNWWFFV